MSRVQQIHRLVFLHECLRTMSHLNYEQLAQTLGVSQRTLYRDLRLLRIVPVQLESIARTNLRQTGISLDSLTEQEAAALLAKMVHNVRLDGESHYGRIWEEVRMRISNAINNQTEEWKTTLNEHLTKILTDDGAVASAAHFGPAEQSPRQPAPARLPGAYARAL